MERLLNLIKINTLPILWYVLAGLIILAISFLPQQMIVIALRLVSVIVIAIPIIIIVFLWLK